MISRAKFQRMRLIGGGLEVLARLGANNPQGLVSLVGYARDAFGKWADRWEKAELADESVQERIAREMGR